MFCKKGCSWKFHNFFFLSGFSFTDTDDSQDSRGREGTIFYSTLPLPPAHDYSDIYLQLCMWDDYHMFLIAPLIFTACIFTNFTGKHLCQILFFNEVAGLKKAWSLFIRKEALAQVLSCGFCETLEWDIDPGYISMNIKPQYSHDW